MIVTAFLALTGLQSAKAAGYCSLSVRVLSPEQWRQEEVLVSVRENSGRIIKKWTTSEDVKFCDLGIMPVTVTVGRDTCNNQTIVKDVRLSWDKQYVLTVTYDLQSCFDGPRFIANPFPRCVELFRIADMAGNWIENALIQFNPSGLKTQKTDNDYLNIVIQNAPLRYKAQKTDNAGRVRLMMEAGEKVKGTISAEGYQSKTFSLSCSRPLYDYEELIKLKKSP